MSTQTMPEQSTGMGESLTETEASAINSATFMVEQAQQHSDEPEVIAATVVAAAICYHAERFVDGCELIAHAVIKVAGEVENASHRL
jgi:intracellular septation protein A